jgi:O-antigen ligase
MENQVFLLMFGSILFFITAINPFSILPIFIIGSYIEFMLYFPGLVQYNPTVILGIIALSAWLLHLLIYRDLPPTKSKQILIIWIFILWTFCNSLVHRDSSFEAFIDFLRMLIPYFFFAYIVKTRKQMSIIVWILLIIGTITALYGIYQLKANIGVYDRGVKRIVSFMDNPNAFGNSLTILVPLALGLLFYRKYNLFMKGVILAILACLIAGVVISFSRGCFIALMFGIFFSVAKFFKRSKKVFAFMATFCLLLVIIYLFPDRQKYILWARLRTIIRADSVETIDTGRTETAKAGIEIMREKPIFGVGLAGFTNEYFRLASESPDIKVVSKDALVPHNLYIQVGSSLGIPGLALYLLLVLFIFKDLRSAEQKFRSKNDGLLMNISMAFQIMIMVFLISGFFGGALMKKIFWILAPLAIALRRISLQEEQKALLKIKHGR